MENISKIFNTDDMTEIKSSFKEILKEKFQYEINQYDDWFFNKETCDDLMQECYEEVLRELKIELKNAVKENILKSFQVVKKKLKWRFDQEGTMNELYEKIKSLLQDCNFDGFCPTQQSCRHCKFDKDVLQTEWKDYSICELFEIIKRNM